MITTEISNNQDTIDSRDIQERIDYLESLDEEDIDDCDKEELANLQAFKEEVDSSEWESGISFVHEHYFEDYARDFAEDIGAIGKDTQWPATHIGTGTDNRYPQTFNKSNRHRMSWNAHGYCFTATGDHVRDRFSSG